MCYGILVWWVGRVGETETRHQNSYRGRSSSKTQVERLEEKRRNRMFCKTQIEREREREREGEMDELTEEDRRALRGSKFAPLPAPPPALRTQPRLAHPGGPLATNKAAALAKFLERKLQEPGGLDSINPALLERAVKNAKDTIHASGSGASNSGIAIRHVASFGDPEVSDDERNIEDQKKEIKRKKHKKKKNKKKMVENNENTMPSKKKKKLKS